MYYNSVGQLMSVMLSSIKSVAVHVRSNIVSNLLLTLKYSRRAVRTLAVRNRTTTDGSYSVAT